MARHQHPQRSGLAELVEHRRAELEGEGLQLCWPHALRDARARDPGERSPSIAPRFSATATSDELIALAGERGALVPSLLPPAADTGAIALLRRLQTVLALPKPIRGSPVSSRLRATVRVP